MGERFSRGAIFPAFLLLPLLLLPLPVCADTLDQIHFWPHHANWTLGMGSGQYFAQTYTAGITGTLTGVSVNVWPQQFIYPLQVSIFSASNGQPTWTVLGTTTLAPGQPGAGQDTFIPIPGSVGQVAGTQYAIVLTYSAPQGWGVWTGSWPDHDVYPRGQAWTATTLGGNWSAYGAWADLHFMTYVEPVPEPATLLLLGTGLTGLWLKRRTR